MIRALNVLFPGTGPGGYFRNGSLVSGLDEESKGRVLINHIARTLIRSWLESEVGREFGVERKGLNPSLQIEVKPNRPFPGASLKWNKVTKGTTDRLQIEESTVRYIEIYVPGWGNNRSPNNDYVAGSTKSEAFESPFKTVYFDHLTKTDGISIASEAFTGLAPGARDIRAPPAG